MIMHNPGVPGAGLFADLPQRNAVETAFGEHDDRRFDKPLAGCERVNPQSARRRRQFFRFSRHDAASLAGRQPFRHEVMEKLKRALKMGERAKACEPALHPPPGALHQRNVLAETRNADS